LYLDVTIIDGDEAWLKGGGMKNVLSVILGGGRGSRLYPLTKYRAKPAVPLAGKYRLIDIPISNCLNSGLQKIFVLTQFNSVSLNRHIFRAYKFDTFSQGYVEILADRTEYGTRQLVSGFGRRRAQMPAPFLRSSHRIHIDSFRRPIITG